MGKEHAAHFDVVELGGCRGWAARCRLRAAAGHGRARAVARYGARHALAEEGVDELVDLTLVTAVARQSHRKGGGV